MIGCKSQQTRNRPARASSQRGFSLIEIVVVVSIALVLAAIAIPVMTRSLQYFRFRSAVSSVTGAIQSAKYQAVFQGCPFQVAFVAGTYTYQILGENKQPAPATGCVAGFVARTNALPLSGSGVTLTANSTLQFSPSGKVTSPVGLMTMTLTSAPQTATITISNFGNVNVNIH
jgi:prepilin-type N-terminal cleavage/methylation domain-containing protein